MQDNNNIFSYFVWLSNFSIRCHGRKFSFMSKSIPPYNNIAITIVSVCWVNNIPAKAVSLGIGCKQIKGFTIGLEAEVFASKQGFFSHPPMVTITWDDYCKWTTPPQSSGVVIKAMKRRKRGREITLVRLWRIKEFCLMTIWARLRSCEATEMMIF